MDYKTAVSLKVRSESELEEEVGKTIEVPLFVATIVLITILIGVVLL